MKKFNLAIITLLLVFQTVLSPISVLAAEGDPVLPPVASTEGDDANTNADNTDEPSVTVPEENNPTDSIPPASPEEGSTDDDNGSALPEENGTDDNNNESSVTPPPTTSEEDNSEEALSEAPEIDANGEEDGEVPTEDVTSLEDPDAPMITPLNVTPTDLTANATLSEFELTINGEPVRPPAFDTELSQNQQAQGKFVFEVDLPDDVKAGDFFTYTLSPSLIDFDGEFNGNLPETATSPAFEWSTSGNLVTVTITADPPEEVVGALGVAFIMNFTSGFNLSGNNVEQNLAIPNTSGGTDYVTLTFLPTTSNESMVSKESTGVSIDNGERFITWEAWVNRAGKNLTGATLQDTPDTGHEIVANSVTVETYEVGLNGVITPATGTQDNVNFEDIEFNGKNAYKITYRTKVNLPIADQEGQKTFGNNLTLTDPTHSGSDTATATTTYGKALDKNLDTSKTNNNYISSWEILYNYNQAAISQAEAWIEDTLPTGHVIDIATIKVYEVPVNDTGTATGAGSEIDASEYKVNPIINGFKLAFNDNITKAYRVTYDAKLVDDFYVNSSSLTMTNTVMSGTASQPETATHILTEDILTKSRTVDTDKKEITWTITVKADNESADGTAITGLTIEDTFVEGTYNALHTLVDANNDSVANNADITVSNMTGQNITINTNGFTLTGGTVAKGQTATITYKTAYEILPDGSVHAQGYGNTAVANWTTDKPYSVTKSAHYQPASNSVNNGRKQGTYDYIEQVFNWNIKVNINKQNINNAVLHDVIGEGHEIVPGSFVIKEFTLTNPDNDELGTEGADLASGLYDLAIAPDNKRFTLTFANDLGTANNKVYIVKYQTKDSDNIIGIESTTKDDKSKAYTNTATFTTNVGAPRVYNLPATPVTPTYTNQLITKGAPSANSTTERLTWTLNVNRSLSTLGATTVSDTPSENQMLLKDTIRVKKYNVHADNGTSVPGGAWSNPADYGLAVTFPATGGFEIDFGELNKEGYQIQYQTLVLGKQGDPFSNDAKINFGFATANNQEKEAKYSNNFSFSASDADFSLTKGTLKFNKVGLHPLTGIKRSLADVEFELVKVVRGTDYIVATATSNADGNITFEDVNYANYTVREKAAPVGYDLMDNYPIRLDVTTDTDLAPNASKVIELINYEQVDTTNACDRFTLTVRDIDGNLITGEQITLVNSNEIEFDVGSTDGSGQITTIKRPGVSGLGTEVPAGTYTVMDENSNILGTIAVKYNQGECQDEVQPANACDVFTITVKDEDGQPRQNVTVTLKNTNNEEVVTRATNQNGQFTVPSTTPAGTYKLYEGTQYLGDVNITYQNGNCQDEVIQAPKCEIFELTIRDVDGELVADNTEVTIKDENGQVIATERTVDGKVELQDLEPGTYTVEDENGVEIGEFSSNINCRGEVQQKPACPQFTVELKDDNDVLVPASQSVVIKDKLGNTIPTTIDADGRITFVSEDVPAGMYDVYDNKVYLGEIEVSYKQTCQTKLQIAPACPEFTLTINNAYGQPRAGVKVTITGEDGVDVEENGSTEFTTNSQGQIVISNSIIKPGKYVVKENGQTIIGTITVGNTCEAIIQPPRPVTPPNPDNPTPDPEPGTPGPNNPDPNNPKPNEPGPNNPDPNSPEPNEPGPNNPDPNNPKPNEPGPNNPDPNNPEPNEPVDPNNPDPNNPEPNEPVDPNNPNPNESVNPNNPDPSNPANPTPRPNNPSASGNGDVTVQDVISQGQQLPAFDPSNATNQALKAYQDFLNNYNKLSKEDQAKVAQAIDINKIKADAERLESLLRSKGKLPQTDEANQTALVVVGLLLVIGAVLLMRRRQTKA
ncbi:collagen binding domain-containing protein [Lysinibacillus sp. NPDC098008]|uniref:collagen binding domain-containing protein n=1 Tax=Lysinibacillus sp. NPDC098008 TaxID=3364146 RepID=UPI0038136A4A